MHINVSKTRQFLIFIAFIALFVALSARLLYIQIIRNKFFKGLAEKQHKTFIKLAPQRGTIYDRVERVLAMYLGAPSVYAVPREIDSDEDVSRTLAKELNVERSVIQKRLAKDNYFAWIKRKITPEGEEKIKKLSIKGVYLTSEGQRFYPGNRLACHVLGITGMDNKGLEGIELYYDKELAGEYGWRRSYRDAKKREIISFQSDALPARNGTNLTITIDEVIQHIIEKEVENLVKTFRPKGVSVIAMDPRTGEVLGLANYPWFNPNDISDIKQGSLRNRAIADSFEPGSVFKIVTASAALEEGVVDFDSKFFCENGSYKIGKRILHDYRPHGMLNFREIIEKSSNIGVAKVAARLGRDKLYEYVERFNFGSVTGIDLPGEASGIVRDVSSWGSVDMTTVPMGQGIAITALQLANAISRIANDGLSSPCPFTPL